MNTDTPEQLSRLAAIGINVWTSGSQTYIGESRNKRIGYCVAGLRAMAVELLVIAARVDADNDDE